MREATGVPWTGATPVLEVRDSSRPYHCPSYKLPEYGVIEISPGYTINLTTNAIFRPQCTSASQGADGDGTGQVLSVADIRDPFHASITPQAYATGAATVIAWMLVIMLIITPRTFFVGNASGRSGLMGRRGMISGASGGGSIIGVGSRPWLQKVAALTVAISLTLATADTFKIAGRQYGEGFIDAMELRDQVVSGMEIKVSRIISDIFLWLAQVQTLIRLFPRHKEKVIIKWVGFALILLDIIFSALNSFGPYDDNPRPAHFDTAIPALSYLFQLSLSMLYAAWVLYYATTKRRYAFYHSMMWNMSVVALLSIIAILTPVVFFITDIANYTIAGWGDYFRWVGAAAASVIVWEWVERIEALEREERKDGILGREIYDGDDMLDNTPSSSSTTSKWPYSKRTSSSEKKGGGDGGLGGFNLSAFAAGQTSRVGELAQKWGRKMTESPRAEARKKRTIHVPAPAPVHQRSESARGGDRSSSAYVRVQSPVPPPAVPVVASPVSRTDTTSADSTVYTVLYHPINETPPIRQSGSIEDRLTPEAAKSQQTSAPQKGVAQPANANDPEKGATDPESFASNSRWNWQAIANPFTRKGRAPPQELQRGQVIEPLAVDEVHANIPPRNYNGLAISDRLGTFAAQQGERFRSKKKIQVSEMNLPVTIIPAQPRGQTWSPDSLQRQQQQREDIGTPQSEVSATAGIQIARIPTTIEEQSDVPSPTDSEQTVNSSEVVEPPTSANDNRNARRRYTPRAGGLTAHPTMSPASLVEEIQSPTPLLDHASQAGSSSQ
ncbi:pH-response regulator protein palH/rim-21 [Didymella exigua CBS 183.55]|uniref:pH-response regulator protein palH/rim-21 n=1 Tax=Didymella exigua CBS 183.55 TaxID=1150837 RepID=A0A6A5R7K6_9PLEO|nr:pH-response regulator protein palH/rim-21 [Didymella exigua CBS 183.55]KAF1924155.1 pH-response regulator protein palH/rim-21 [Didymella exigua CBS 183.55]